MVPLELADLDDTSLGGTVLVLFKPELVGVTLEIDIVPVDDLVEIAEPVEDDTIGVGDELLEMVDDSVEGTETGDDRLEWAECVLLEMERLEDSDDTGLATDREELLVFLRGTEEDEVIVKEAEDDLVEAIEDGLIEADDELLEMVDDVVEGPEEEKSVEAVGTDDDDLVVTEDDLLDDVEDGLIEADDELLEMVDDVVDEVEDKSLEQVDDILDGTDDHVLVREVRLASEEVIEVVDVEENVEDDELPSHFTGQQ